jgi:hypothetical protein
MYSQMVQGEKEHDQTNDENSSLKKGCSSFNKTE